MKLFYFLLLSLVGIPCTAQVGINTSEPDAILDISSSNRENPSTKDGILIPRISKFPGSLPSHSQNGMLVYLDSNHPDANKGFYYWDAEDTEWMPINGKISRANFYETSTKKSPENIEDPIFRNGQLGIGTEERDAKLQIRINPGKDNATKKGLYIDNQNSEETRNTYGIEAINRSETNAIKYGIKSNVNGIGNGIHYGIFSETYQSAGTSDIYGILSRVGRTHGARSNNYGIYSEIGSASGQGNIYGIYATALGDSNANVFAGYFAGRLGIGGSPSVEYIFPPQRGGENMILSLASNGNLRWRLPSYQSYNSTTSTTGIYTIEEDISTIRINNNLDSIQIPSASDNRGRIITLISWATNTTKELRFSAGDDLFDVTTNRSITSIKGGSVLTIQSAGNRWILIHKLE